MTRILAHAHTNWSHDSSLTLRDWVDIARERSCGAILLTEHEESGWTEGRYQEYVAACADATTPDVEIVAGIEFNQGGFHVLCYGLSSFLERPCGLPELVRRVEEQGCWLCLAHPPKYRWRYPHSLVAAVHAVEVWNSKWIYDGTIGPHPSTMAMAAGKLWLVGQDVHKRAHLSDLYLETLTNAFLPDLRAGRYRISTGQRTWTPEELSSRALARVTQRVRTTALHMALPAYSWSRRKFAS